MGPPLHERIQFLKYIRQLPAGMDRRHHAHPHPQPVLGIAFFVYGDFDGNPLDDLDIVASGILWGEQGKSGTGACHNALYAPCEFAPGIGIHPEFHHLARFHMAQLALLVIGGHASFRPVWIVGTTLIPIRSPCSGSLSLSMVILMGTLWTTLT